jgi:hypothetical protein
MTMAPGGIVANVSAMTLGQPFTLGLGGSYIQTFTLDGARPGDVEFTLNSFAHEFGHVLGLDLYDTGGSMGRAPGYENNIMANSSVGPNWQNFRDLIDENS